MTCCLQCLWVDQRACIYMYIPVIMYIAFQQHAKGGREGGRGREGAKRVSSLLESQ